LKVRSRLFYCYLFFIVVYAAFVLLPAPLHATLVQYHLSALGVRLIDLTIIFILAVIWFAGLYGYTRLQSYAKLIEGHKDGKHVAKLTKGIFLLVIWLPVSSVVSVILNFFATKHQSLVPATTIINNYVNLLFPFLGFIFIGMAARGLSEYIRIRPRYVVTNALVLVNLFTGIIYYRLVATTLHRASIYHMSIWLILTTLVVPYVFMWSVGLQAAYEILIYRQKVRGAVYKKSWHYLALGIGWLIVTSMVFQYVTTLSPRLIHLSIYWLLALIYSLLLLLSIGFVLIALGTRKLQKIEEV
jgi:hypothetical protein